MPRSMLHPCGCSRVCDSRLQTEVQVRSNAGQRIEGNADKDEEDDCGNEVLRAVVAKVIGYVS